MVKSSGIWVDQLVSLIGLDTETVKTQIIPFLDSFDDEVLLKSHLEGLLGTDSRAKTFIRDFVRSRFPSSQVPTGSVEVTDPAPASAPASSFRSGNASSSGRKGKKTLAERAGIGQPLPPRQIEVSPQMDQLASQFGSMGTAYKKDDRVEDALYAGFPKSRKGKDSERARDHGVEVRSANQSPSRPRSPAASVQTEYTAAGHDKASSSAQESSKKPPPPPTVEMLAIDTVMEELTLSPPLSTDGSKPSVCKTCFCQGRKHSLAPYAPLCYACGLIICAATVPSPLSPLSSCPSCSASPLLSAPARADLLSKLADERQTLYEQQLVQIQVQRDLKRTNKQSGLGTPEENLSGLFPKLSDQLAFSPQAQSSQQQPVHVPVFGKHGALKKAQAMAKDAERTAKVLSLDPKTRRVTQARPKPKSISVSKAPSPAPSVQPIPDNDPYVGLDGSHLVRNPKDDAFARGKEIVDLKQKSVPRQSLSAIQTREWILDGRKLLVKAP